MGKIKTIEIEAASTVFVGELIRLNRRAFTPIRERKGNSVSMRLPFMKMSYARRKNVVSATMDKLQKVASKG